MSEIKDVIAEQDRIMKQEEHDSTYGHLFNPYTPENLKKLVEAQKEAQKKYGGEHLIVSGPNKGSTITLTFYTPPKQSQEMVKHE